MNALSKYSLSDLHIEYAMTERQSYRSKGEYVCENQSRHRQTAVTNWLPINLRPINQSWASTSLPAMPLSGYRRIGAEKEQELD